MIFFSWASIRALSRSSSRIAWKNGVFSSESKFLPYSRLADFAGASQLVFCVCRKGNPSENDKINDESSENWTKFRNTWKNMFFLRSFWFFWWKSIEIRWKSYINYYFTVKNKKKHGNSVEIDEKIKKSSRKNQFAEACCKCAPLHYSNFCFYFSHFNVFCCFSLNFFVNNDWKSINLQV